MLTFVLTPERVRVGGEVVATVTLTRAAEAGGVVIVPQSQFPELASVPGPYTMAAGATVSTYTVRAFGRTGSGPDATIITSNTSAIIEAKINGVGRAAALVVEP